MPPINPSLPDSKNLLLEPELFADNTSEDTNYFPDAYNKRVLVIERDSDSEYSSDSDQVVQDQEEDRHSTSQSPVTNKNTKRKQMICKKVKEDIVFDDVPQYRMF